MHTQTPWLRKKITYEISNCNKNIVETIEESQSRWRNVWRIVYQEKMIFSNIILTFKFLIIYLSLIVRV